MHKLNLPIHGDALVRFLYCRLPGINFALNRLLFWHLYASRISQLDARFEEARRMLARLHFDFRGKTVLELRPGNARINAYNFLALGVRKVILVDKWPRKIKSARQKSFEETEKTFITQKYSQRNLKFFKVDKSPASGLIEFRSGDLTKFNLPPIDLIYSISVMEHVRQPADVIEKMSQILVPGGLMYHGIDMRDHYDFRQPFLFYKYSPQIWENKLTKEGISYTNRWRYNDFYKNFKAHGLELRQEKTRSYSLNDVKIHTYLQGRPDLNIGLWDCLWSKPPYIL